MDDTSLQPDSVDFTAISAESIAVTWKDRDESVVYGIKIYSPDTLWWSTTLPIGTEIDTIYGLMPNDSVTINVLPYHIL